MKVVTWNIRGLRRGEKKRAVRKLFDTGHLLRVRWLKLQAVLVAFYRCGFGNIYAPNEDAEKEVLWAELKQAMSNFEVSWCLGGDFNVIRHPEEKIGASFNFAAMSQFSDFIEETGLMDLPLMRGQFTWCSNRAFPTFCRLDRFLVDPEFLLKFQGLYQKLLPWSLSDHHLVSLEVESINWGPKPFKIFNYWMELEVYDNLVQGVWDTLQKEASSLLNLWGKMKEMKKAIKGWYRLRYGGSSSCIARLEEEIHELAKEWASNSSRDDIKQLIFGKKVELWTSYRREERSWYQKSRVRWMQEGDRNTKYFHLMASMRKRVNAIEQLCVNGIICKDIQVIKNAVANHFEAHYDKDEAIPFREFDCRFRRLKESSVVELERPFTDKEAWDALQGCDGNKAPGPADGFNLNFIKRHWTLIKDEMMQIMRVFYDTGCFDCRLNASFIALIPKCDSPSSLNQYRPISLVSSLYKILAKVLANRLRLVIGEVVDDNQFSFMKGSQILDCSLIANEVIEVMKRGAIGEVLLKVDFEKAYDIVSWSFLDLLLDKIGFGVRWRGWIMQCISTVSLSVLVNGVATRQFQTHRGLRQGCSLSPFLFNIIVEGLGVLLHKAVTISLFRGVSFGEGDQVVSHLQFTDDSLIFCEPEEYQIQNVKRVLRCFQVISGLKINFSKSRLVGVGVDRQVVEVWASNIYYKVDSLPIVYLGLPLGVRGNSVVAWNPVVQKFERKLSGWKSSCLSTEGRITLIRSVLASLPLYYMSLFKIPVIVKQNLEKIQRRFLWGTDGNKRRIHGVGWEQVCNSRKNGGLGLVELDIKNCALLHKWICRYSVETDSLWRKAIVGIYGCGDNELLPNVANHRSFSSL
ncbi:hypothetical protein DITRI_Ditri20bG0039100 [Diplodiscus trichospermus]